MGIMSPVMTSQRERDKERQISISQNMTEKALQRKRDRKSLTEKA